MNIIKAEKMLNKKYFYHRLKTSGTLDIYEEFERACKKNGALAEAELLESWLIVQKGKEKDGTELTQQRREQLQSHAQNLLEQHWDVLTRPFHALGASGVTFADNGIATALDIDFVSFLNNAQYLFELGMINGINFTGFKRGSRTVNDVEVGRFATDDRFSVLKNVQYLAIQGDTYGDEGVLALAKCPHLKELRILDLGQAQVTEKGICALLTSEQLPQLREIHLDNPKLAVYVDDVNRALDSRHNTPHNKVNIISQQSPASDIMTGL